MLSRLGGGLRLLSPAVGMAVAFISWRSKNNTRSSLPEVPYSIFRRHRESWRCQIAREWFRRYK